MWKREDTIAEDTDRELVSQALAGDQDAMEQLIQRHYRSCLQLAARILGDRFEALDEVQNTCWKVFALLRQYQCRGEFVAWMHRIVVNQCLTVLRARRQRRHLYVCADWSHENGFSVDLPCPRPAPEQQLLDAEAILPAVKSRLHRARLELRRRITRYYGDGRPGNSKTRVANTGPEPQWLQ